MTAQLSYPCGPIPAAGETREVAPGVVWIRMPLPFALDHINVWAIRDDEAGNSWTIIDTGLQAPATINAWRSILTGSGLLGGAVLSRVLITHMHLDHFGMAGWITRKFGCRLWASQLEYLNGRVMTAAAGRDAPEDSVRFYRAAGWTEDDLENYRARFGLFGAMVHQIPDSYRRLQDEETVRIGGHDWRVITGQGHSPDHACLHCADLKLLVSGDQVLPKISTNVSVHPIEPDADPLGGWLSSIEKIRREVPDDVLVLPGHNEPFRGLYSRLDRLASGHARGLESLMDHLHEPRRVVDLFSALFGRPVTSEPNLLWLATGESLAHVNYLLRRGEAVVERAADGVAWYRRAGSCGGSVERDAS